MGGSIMVDTTNSQESVWDLLIIWVGAILGHLTLSSAVLWATLIYTLIRIYLIIKNELLKK
jgi:hypothetical protein